jgi:hypothetical protein
MVWGQPGQIDCETHPPPISKITKEKWTGGVAQVLELLFGKGAVLSLNLSLTKK